MTKMPRPRTSIRGTAWGHGPLVNVPVPALKRVGDHIVRLWAIRLSPSLEPAPAHQRCTARQDSPDTDGEHLGPRVEDATMDAGHVCTMRWE
jgi:hypothetical protein